MNKLLYLSDQLTHTNDTQEHEVSITKITINLQMYNLNT